MQVLQSSLPSSPAVSVPPSPFGLAEHGESELMTTHWSLHQIGEEYPRRDEAEGRPGEERASALLLFHHGYRFSAGNLQPA